VATVVLGAGLRLNGLDHKVYWHDEAYTSLHLSGYPGIEDLLSPGGNVSVRALQERQRITTDRGPKYVVASVKGEPENPPLYFLLLRLWASWAGDSPVALRALSAASSILSLVLLAWLTWELFQSTLTVLVAGILMAGSPVLIAQAQEARGYSLWVAAILFSGVMLLRAIRASRLAPWIAYGCSVGVGLYSSPLFLSVILAHGLFLAALCRWMGSALAVPSRRAWLRYVVANAIGMVAFAPWLRVIVERNGPAGLGWAAVPLEPLRYGRALVTALGTLVVDFGSDFSQPGIWRWVYRLGTVVLVTFLGWTVIAMWRRGPLPPALFVALQVIVPVAMLLVPDVVFGGRRATVPRYLLAAHVGLLLAMARVLADRVGPGARNRRRWPWCVALLLLVGLELSSYHTWTRSTVWWTKLRYAMPREVARDMQAMAETVNRSRTPLLIVLDVGYRTGDLLALSHILRPEVRLLSVLELPASVYHNGDLWLWVPSYEQPQHLGAQGQRLDAVPDVSGLWRVQPP
jgi:uncharacterized membrane protein